MASFTNYLTGAQTISAKNLLTQNEFVSNLQVYPSPTSTFVVPYGTTGANCYTGLCSSIPQMARLWMNTSGTGSGWLSVLLS